jgi:hypothetical protein
VSVCRARRAVDAAADKGGALDAATVAAATEELDAAEVCAAGGERGPSGAPRTRIAPPAAAAAAEPASSGSPCAPL